MVLEKVFSYPSYIEFKKQAYKAMRKMAIARIQTEEFYVAFDQIRDYLGPDVCNSLNVECNRELGLPTSC